MQYGRRKIKKKKEEEGEIRVGEGKGWRWREKGTEGGEKGKRNMILTILENLK